MSAMTTVYQLRRAWAIRRGERRTQGAMVFRTTIRRTRSGAVSARANAVLPPQSWPITSACSISSASSSDAASAANVTGS